MTSNCIQLDDEDDGAKDVEEIEEEIEETPKDDGLPEDTENEIDEANEEELVQDDDLDLKTPEDTKAENVAALLRGDVQVSRAPLLPKVLSVSSAAVVIRRPFKSPCPRTPAGNNGELLRRLSARKRFIPWCSARQPFSPVDNLLPPLRSQPELTEDVPSKELPPEIEPLVLWQPEDAPDSVSENQQPIIVDTHLVRFLRQHQREGVQFMFECVAGLRELDTSTTDGICRGYGCILADDMGLGKTLQSITLLWTLLKQGFDGRPMAKRVLIITPTSLVSNWESEIKKWLNHRTINVLAMCESTRADVLQGIATFLAPHSLYQVLILSYETFRLHASKFHKEGSCDLLICDEAHRLKNDKTLTNQALASLPCFRRVLLSGTPMQNDLEEFYAMVNFTNPGVLGDAITFRRHYENPILNGREPDATDDARALGIERSGELSHKVNQFILRRTNALLSNHLPPKIIEVVCCRMTDLQTDLYRHFIRSKNLRQALEDKTKRARVLASITALKKLCNHPKLIYDTLRAGGSEAAGFEDCMPLFPQHLVSSRSAMWANWIELSGKMAVLAHLLAELRQKTDDRIVLVSNYTQTLDLFAQICRERNYPFVRLDGTTTISKRQKMVQRFNDPTSNEFAFLLSSKAGGCGLNLIGGNRLVLFDPDWNPATDKQAAARVWRDGQKKRVYVYRFLTTGTIEEKVYQRQMSKESLQKVVDKDQANDAKTQVNALSTEDLRDLFTLHENIRSDTHDSLNCKRCETSNLSGSENTSTDCEVNDTEDIGQFAKVAGCLDRLMPWQKQVGTPSEEDLSNWAHHTDAAAIPDAIFQAAAGTQVSFAFTCQIDGKLTPIDSFPRSSLLSKGPHYLPTIREQPPNNLSHNIPPASPAVLLKEGTVQPTLPGMNQEELPRICPRSLTAMPGLRKLSRSSGDGLIKCDKSNLPIVSPTYCRRPRSTPAKPATPAPALCKRAKATRVVKKAPKRRHSSSDESTATSSCSSDQDSDDDFE
ncbi:unnamed protein product [Sphagnum tenellum]